MTIRLYDVDAYTKKFTARVIACQLRPEGSLAVILDQTAFFPEAGGQSADTGTIEGLTVTDVQIDPSGVITHYCKLPDDQTNPLQEGQTACCRIDWDRRYVMMQHHTGEHMFSGLVNREYGYDNVGFHLSDHICTMDYNGSLTPEDVRRLEIACNRLICQNETITCTYPDDETLNALAYRCKGELTPPIRIVTIENVDCCACCAPHVRRTGEVGLLKVTECKTYKGGVRLTILCGQKAFADYCHRFDILSAVSQQFSSHYETLEARTAQLMEERNALSQKLREAQQARLACLIQQAPAATREEPAVFFVEDVDAKGLRFCVNTLMEEGDGICAIFCGNEEEGYSFIAGSKGLDMKALANHLRLSCHAKCGGSEQMIQGQVSASRQAIQNALRQFSKTAC